MEAGDDLFRMLRSAAKPGHKSREQAERAAFTAELIKALEAADVGRKGVQSDLAGSAFDKLQFDFPLVSAEELAALIDCHKHRGGYPLTPKYLSVLREGASTAELASSEARPAARGPMSGSSSDEESEAAAEAAAEQLPPAATSNSLLPLYQQLYGIVLLRALQGALGAWDAATCSRLLGPLVPSLRRQQQQQQQQQQEQELQQQGQHGPAEPSSNVAAGAGTPRGGQERGGGSAAQERLGGPQEEAAEAIPRDVPAQQEDQDETAYEPLEQPGSSRQQQQVQLAPAPWAWRQEAHLLPTLAALAGQLSWHCLSNESVWRDQALMQELVASLAAVRRHTQFPQLCEGVAEPLLRLAVARVGSCPTDVGCFGSLLDGLGMAEPGTPHPEAVRLALSTGAMLARQLSTPAARRALWQDVHTALLPLAAAQLDGVQTALAKRAKQAAVGVTRGAKGTNGAAAAPSAATPAAAAVQPTEEEAYRIMAACQLLYFYVLHTPPALLAAGRLDEALLGGGLFRALVLLFALLAAQPEAESLRCALLLSCAASAGLLQWAAVVPGFTSTALGLRSYQQEQQQQQPEGEEDWAHELPSQRLAVHGALWSLLLDKGPRGAEPLVGLLQAAADAPEQVGHAVGLLQLMSALHQVSRQRRLWPAAVDAALRGLGEAIKQESRQARAEAEGAEAPVQSEQQLSGAVAMGAAADAAARGSLQEEEEREARKLRLSAGQQAQRLASRRAQQLHPLCLKLVKELTQRQGAAGKHD